MPDLDLYAIHGLDRSAPSQALAAQLTAQLNTAPEPLARQRIDTARAILGDPQRRARYDAQLSDPAAPPITEATLAALAGRPAPVQARPAFAQPRVLAAIAAFIGILLVVVISAVACSGGDNDAAAPDSADGSATTAAEDRDDSPGCRRTTSEHLSYMKWSTQSRPAEILLLIDAYDLPGEFATMATRTDPITTTDYPFAFDGLTQYQDKNIGIYLSEKGSGAYDRNGYPDTVLHGAIVSQNGEIVSSKTYTAAQRRDIPEPFDLAKKATSGYFRVEGKNGIEIPSAAAGDKQYKNNALAVLPDAFDDRVVWVAMRGSAKLFKAALYEVDPGVEAVAPIVGSCTS